MLKPFFKTIKFWHLTVQAPVLQNYQHIVTGYFRNFGNNYWRSDLLRVLSIENANIFHEEKLNLLWLSYWVCYSDCQRIFIVMELIFSTWICLVWFVYLDLCSWIYLLGSVLEVSVFCVMCKSIVAVIDWILLLWQ